MGKGRGKLASWFVPVVHGNLISALYLPKERDSFLARRRMFAALRRVFAKFPINVRVVLLRDFFK